MASKTVAWRDRAGNLYGTQREAEEADLLEDIRTTLTAEGLTHQTITSGLAAIKILLSSDNYFIERFPDAQTTEG